MAWILQFPSISILRPSPYATQAGPSAGCAAGAKLRIVRLWARISQGSQQSASLYRSLKEKLMVRREEGSGRVRRTTHAGEIREKSRRNRGASTATFFEICKLAFFCDAFAKNNAYAPIQVAPPPCCSNVKAGWGNASDVISRPPRFATGPR